MVGKVLPQNIALALYKKQCDYDINEIRIRLNKPIVVICNQRAYFLSFDGLCSNPNSAIIASKEIIDEIVFKASDYSLYSVNEQIKQGYLTVDGGIRIGLCGEVVLEGDKIKTIKDFTSLCIRIPHDIKGVCKPIFNKIVESDNVLNTLIISPPGAGKTTMLRDIIFQLSSHNYSYNVFIADERGEIVGGKDNPFNLGCFFDYISFLNKKESLIFGLRSISPDIVVTDEISKEEDISIIKHLIGCGVSVIATVHAKDIDDLKRKEAFKDFIMGRYFKRYIVLSKANGVGTIEGVYREDLTRIYGGTL